MVSGSDAMATTLRLEPDLAAVVDRARTLAEDAGELTPGQGMSFESRVPREGRRGHHRVASLWHLRGRCRSGGGRRPRPCGRVAESNLRSLARRRRPPLLRGAGAAGRPAGPVRGRGQRALHHCELVLPIGPAANDITFIGALSRRVDALQSQGRELVLAQLDELPATIGLVSARLLVPVMAKLRTPRLNLAAEALATAVVVEDLLWWLPHPCHSPRLAVALVSTSTSVRSERVQEADERNSSPAAAALERLQQLRSSGRRLERCSNRGTSGGREAPVSACRGRASRTPWSQVGHILLSQCRRCCAEGLQRDGVMANTVAGAASCSPPAEDLDAALPSGWASD